MKRLIFMTIAVVFLLPGQALGLVITATAIGSSDLTVQSNPGHIQNGDFLIWYNPGVTFTGDGVDEATYWTFDFTTDANFSVFPTSVPLQSAELTLTLTPKAGDIATDQVRIGGYDTSIPDYFGLPRIETPIIQSLPLHVTSTVYLELLDFYTSDEILGALNGAYPPNITGHIPMHYSDDAIVSFAQLDLDTPAVPVPEPATVLLLGTGLVGFVGFRKRFKK